MNTAFAGISDQGDRFSPVHGIDVRDVRAWPIRTGGSTGNVGRFGMTRDGGNKQHPGLDLLVAPGAPIYAAHEGEILRAGEQVSPGPAGAGYGLRLYLRAPDGTETLYAHLSALAGLETGSYVRPGYVIGFAGRSGNVDRSVPTHLHFGVRVGGSWVDPEGWLAWEI